MTATDPDTLREQLLALGDPAFRSFQQRLIPGARELIGVRMPQLRRIARQIARGDWRTFLDGAASRYYEERMVQGLVIGYARCTARERMERLTRFIPLVDNWALCDCCCCRVAEAERPELWRLIDPLFSAEGEYTVRFAVVMALVNFIDEEHLEELLARLERLGREEYYIRMAVAWAVSVCFVRFPGPTRRWLETCRLDDWTFDKSLQKIRESLRVDAATKEEIGALKRHRRSRKEA